MGFCSFFHCRTAEGVRMPAHLQDTLDTPNNVSTWQHVEIVYLKSSSVACQLS